MPRALAVVALLVALLGFYFFLLGARGLSLLGDDRLVVQGLGLGVLLLPVLGLALVVGELRFGRDAQRLGEQLDREDPDPSSGTVPSSGAEASPDTEPSSRTEPRPGRRDYARADAVFAQRKAEVERDPQDWRAWYRLGAAYGDSGDVARGRRAVRRAIALERRSRR